MRRHPDPYRVLVFALDAGDQHLAALIARRLLGESRRIAAPGPAAERTVERLMALLPTVGSPG